jgi:ribonuclease J
MVNNVKIARELGYLHDPDNVLLSIDQIAQLPDRQVAIVCTGSQGEPTSALVRMSQNNFRSLKIQLGDTVIVSASPIPGNEELINHTLDNLFRLGANVYYDEVLDVHVSGHASQEEQKLMLNLIRPQYFVPIHGEYRHLVLHSKLAHQCGITPDRIFIMETGDVLEIDGNGAEVVDKVSEDYVLVDGLGMGSDGQNVLDERRLLSQNGFLVATIILDKYTGGLVGEPRIVTHGFVYEAEARDLIDLIKDEIARAVELRGTRSELAERLTAVLSHVARQRTGRHPLVIPIVTKV